MKKGMFMAVVAALALSLAACDYDDGATATVPPNILPMPTLPGGEGAPGSGPFAPPPAPPVLAACPDIAWASQLAGLRLKPAPAAWQDACAFHIETNNTARRVTCEVDYVCVLDFDLAVEGNGRSYTITHNGVWRYVPAYPADDSIHDVCAFAAKYPIITRAIRADGRAC